MNRSIALRDDMQIVNTNNSYKVLVGFFLLLWLV